MCVGRMSDRGYGSDSSVESEVELNESELNSEEEIQQVANVRTAIQNWKSREFGKNKEINTNAEGLNPLRKYVSNTAQLYYDLMTYLNTAKNNEKNMSDKLYVNIISAIGVPGALPFHLKTILQHFLQQDLVELPYTIAPPVINAYAKQGITASKEFPEEE